MSSVQSNLYITQLHIIFPLANSRISTLANFSLCLFQFSALYLKQSDAVCAEIFSPWYLYALSRAGKSSTISIYLAQTE